MSETLKPTQEGEWETTDGIKLDDESQIPLPGRGLSLDAILQTNTPLAKVLGEALEQREITIVNATKRSASKG